MKPSEIASLIRETAAPDSIDELPEVIVFLANLNNTERRSKWTSLRAMPPPYLQSVGINYANRDEPFVGIELVANDDIFRISINKSCKESQLRIFLMDALHLLGKAANQYTDVLVAEMKVNEVFATRAHRYQLWQEGITVQFVPKGAPIDGRSFSRDFTNEGIVPSDLRCWLLECAPHEAGRVFAAWRELACPFLMSSITNYVSGEIAAPLYHFSGPPSFSFKMISEELVKYFDRLTDGLSWVFLEVRDAETRHLLLASEWARSHRMGAITDLGNDALESARNAYSAYVQSGSRETLKALTDLRKALVEESQKATQKAQEFSGSLWKDLAVASIPFAFKLFPDSGKSDVALTSGLIAFAAAIFLVYSFFIQVYINYRYFSVQDESKKVWMTAVCAVLSPSEVEKISEAPLRNAVDDYKSVRLAVGIVYAALVAVLIGLGGHELKAWRP